MKLLWLAKPRLYLAAVLIQGDYFYVPHLGDLHNPKQFNYGTEAWEAWKRGCLSEDLVAELRKVKEADLVIFQVIILNFSYHLPPPV